MADLFFSGWRRRAAFLSILLALLVPLLLIAKAHHESSAYPVAQIKITGYDPRDLLYGHYILFQFDWDWAEGQPPADGSGACYGACCLCLSDADMDPKASVMTCKAAKEQKCTRIVKGDYYGGEAFSTGQNRYLVSQTRALELEDMLRETPDRLRMGITLPPSGKTRLKGLYIDGQPAEDYLRRNPAPLKPDSTFETGNGMTP